jgi:hypothetical protein
LIVEIVGRTIGLEKAFPKRPHQSPIPSAQDHQTVRFSILPEVFQGFCDLLKCIFPGDGFPSVLPTVPNPFEGRADPIGVIKPLKPCDPFRAEGPAIHWMEGVPDDICCPTIDHPYHRSTTAHALGTDGRDPSFNSRFIPFWSRRELGPFPETSAERDGRACAPTHLKKIPAIDLHNSTQWE